MSVKDISAFKREHELEAGEAAAGESDLFGPTVHEEEPDLRAEDEALVAAALEAELDAPEEEDEAEDATSGAAPGEHSDEDSRPRRRRRGRRGGRGRARGGRGGRPLEGTFDHGDEGYGLWLDPAVLDNPVYAEHWAGHRPVTVSIEADRIVITRAGESAPSDNSSGANADAGD